MDKLRSIGLPVDISTHGYMGDRIIDVMHVFMVVLFVGWFAFLLYTLFRFRAREGHKAVYAPKYTKFSTYLEVGIALFEVAVLVVLAIPAWNYAKASVPPLTDALPIRVVAEQFAWNVHYAGPDGVFGKSDPKLMSQENPLGLDAEDPAGKDDVTTINQVAVPVGKKVVVHLSSKDVIHSFGVPTLRVKQDAVPGFTFPVWFEATKTGTNEIVCSQVCGLGHYRMRGTVEVKSETDFQAWLKEQKEASEETIE